MSDVTISDKARAILALCESKESLNAEAEAMTAEAVLLIEQLKLLSVRQKQNLEQQAEIDKMIENIAHSC